VWKFFWSGSCALAHVEKLDALLRDIRRLWKLSNNFVPVNKGYCAVTSFWSHVLGGGLLGRLLVGLLVLPKRLGAVRLQSIKCLWSGRAKQLGGRLRSLILQGPAINHSLHF
jgi:hypothetical protein